MTYRVLLIDADDTVFDFRRAERLALGAMLQARRLPVTPEVQDFYTMTNLKLWKQLERGQKSRDAILTERFTALIDYIRRESAWHPEWNLAGRDWAAESGDLLNRLYLDALARQPSLLPQVEEILPLLAARCRLYLITNGVTRVQRGRLMLSPVAQYFQGIFISEELGVDKPDPLFFQRTLAAIGPVDPADILVVGDSLSADIRGAVNAGLDSVWMNFAKRELPTDCPQPTFIVSSWRELAALIAGADAL
ncbi:MAG: YjjG family noncanonical pyrimidine nucleotidase [Bacillota bacterium]|nr:YjjG family noncanonical pyrimidine nucleotidase [Bacillota bacterium]